MDKIPELYRKLNEKRDGTFSVFPLLAKLDFLRKSCGVDAAQRDKVVINTVPEVNYGN